MRLEYGWLFFIMKRINRIGETYTFKSGHLMKITEYFSNKNLTVQFCDGVIKIKIDYQNFIKGKVKNYNIPSFQGIGYLSYGVYNTIDNKEAYEMWKSIITRCYNPKIYVKYTAYQDCSLHVSWHNFQNFAEWFEKNYIKGFHLDKDILYKGNKVYSAQTCCFVPREINNLFTLRKVLRGKQYLGVFYYKHKNKYCANIGLNNSQKNLGYFDTELEAFNAYKIAKEENIKRLANQFKSQITNQCYNALMNWKIEITD